MKPLLVVVAIVLFAVGASTQDRQPSPPEPPPPPSGPGGPDQGGPRGIQLEGLISKDGGIITGDKDRKIWKIVNSNALKAYDGKHVALVGTRANCSDCLLVTSVKATDKK